MKLVLIILLFSALNIFSFSSNLKITISNNSTTKKFILTAGVDSVATDGWDKDLGEQSYPTVFVPGTFMAYWETTDSSQTNSDGSKYYDILWLDKDLKSIPIDLDRFHKRYKVVYNWGLGTKVEVNWNPSLIDEHIDSAIVDDGFDGIVFKFNMRDTNKFEITNTGIRFFYIDVYFTKIPKSINEEINNNILIYPNPSNDFLKISGIKDFKSIKIYDYLGIDLTEKTHLINNNMIDISLIKSGFYIIEILHENGNKLVRTFIKSN